MPLDFTEMQRLQQALQERYKGFWTPPAPEKGREFLLWMIAEAGEAAEIIKKDGDAAIVADQTVRKAFTEELCDILMYLNDVSICYGITPEEIEKVYRDKHETNMKRW